MNTTLAGQSDGDIELVILGLNLIVSGIVIPALGWYIDRRLTQHHYALQVAVESLSSSSD